MNTGHDKFLMCPPTRACGGIAQAVEQGRIRSGVMYECVRQRVPFVLAGSIRDDGPLPQTLMDLIVAQREYARLIEGADLILMLSSGEVQRRARAGSLWRQCIGPATRKRNVRLQERAVG
jgi:hypothetical protein